MSKCSELLRAVPDYIPRDAVRAYCENVGTEYGLESVEEAWAGEWKSEEDFAWELLEDLGELPKDSLASRYFDLEAFTRDLFIGDYTSERAPDGMVYIFRRI